MKIDKENNVTMDHSEEQDFFNKLNRIQHSNEKRSKLTNIINKMLTNAIEIYKEKKPKKFNQLMDKLEEIRCGLIDIEPNTKNTPITVTLDEQPVNIYADLNSLEKRKKDLLIEIETKHKECAKIKEFQNALRKDKKMLLDYIVGLQNHPNIIKMEENSYRLEEKIKEARVKHTWLRSQIDYLKDKLSTI